VTSKPETPAAHESNWSRRLLLALAAIVALVLLAFAAAAFVPRWWSHLVGRQVDGSMTVGVALGLFYGFVFTALLLLVAYWGFHKRRRWKVWAAFAVATVLVAAPNLMTLGIVIGNGGAAHAAERTLDVDAPGFRNASLAGAIIAVLFLITLEFLLFSRRRARRELAQLRAEKEAKP
jgi:MFS family permease